MFKKPVFLQVYCFRHFIKNLSLNMLLFITFYYIMTVTAIYILLKVRGAGRQPPKKAIFKRFQTLSQNAHTRKYRQYSIQD